MVEPFLVAASTSAVVDMVEPFLVVGIDQQEYPYPQAALVIHMGQLAFKDKHPVVPSESFELLVEEHLVAFTIAYLNFI